MRPLWEKTAKSTGNIDGHFEKDFVGLHQIISFHEGIGVTPALEQAASVL